MGKPSGGATYTGGSIFTTNQTKSGSYGSALYIDFGLIPTGLKIWFGLCQFASPDKSGAFEVRTNLVGQSVGTDAATKLLGSISASASSGTVSLDLYKNNTLHTLSSLGAGIEKIWIKAKAKSSTSGSYYAAINYTTE
jgi:hypothetical protein